MTVSKLNAVSWATVAKLNGVAAGGIANVNGVSCGPAPITADYSSGYSAADPLPSPWVVSAGGQSWDYDAAITSFGETRSVTGTDEIYYNAGPFANFDVWMSFRKLQMAALGSGCTVGMYMGEGADTLYLGDNYVGIRSYYQASYLQRALQTRLKVGGGSATTEAQNVAHNWEATRLRLVRVGDTWTSYYQSDDITNPPTWTQHATGTLSGSTKLYLKLHMYRGAGIMEIYFRDVSITNYTT